MTTPPPYHQICTEVHEKTTATSKSKTAAKDAASKQEQLLKGSPAHCDSCKQTSHDYEQDAAPKKVRVVWHKIYWSKTLCLYVAHGHECYKCFSMRRRFFTDDQTTLDEQRMKDSALDEHCRKLRKAKVLGSDEFNHLERVKADTWVSRREEQFAEAFTEGFVVLNGFAPKGPWAPVGP